MLTYIPDLDDQLRQLGLSEGTEDSAPIRYKEVGGKLRTLAEEHAQWGLAPLTSDLNEGVNEVQSLTAPNPLCGGACASSANAEGCSDESDDSDESDVDESYHEDPDAPLSESEIENLMLYAATRYSESEGDAEEAVEWFGTYDFAEAFAFSALNDLAVNVDGVSSGAELMDKLGESNIEEARRLRAMIGGVVKRLKKTSAKAKRKAKAFYRKHKGQIKRKGRSMRKKASYMKKKLKQALKAKRMGTRESFDGYPAMTNQHESDSYPDAHVESTSYPNLNRTAKLLEEVDTVLSRIGEKDVSDLAESWSHMSAIAMKLSREFTGNGYIYKNVTSIDLGEALVRLSERAKGFSEAIVNNQLDPNAPDHKRTFNEHLESCLRAVEVYHKFLDGKSENPFQEADMG